MMSKGDLPREARFETSKCRASEIGRGIFFTLKCLRVGFADFFSGIFVVGDAVFCEQCIKFT